MNKVEEKTDLRVRSSHTSVRLQTVAVVVLFIGSLAVLLINTIQSSGRLRSQRDLLDQLRTVGQLMAKAAIPVIASGPANEVDLKLRASAAAALANAPGVEGGYFLSDDDRFSGYAFPSTPHGDIPPLPRNEPPPLEAPYIRLQARQALVEDAGQSPIQDYLVGASRVLVCVEPVGPDRPAPAAAWVMARLSGPEQLENQVGRYQLSVGLALTGIVVALVLTLNLGRSLKRQRANEARLNEELRRAEHLASLGRLLAGVAHEIRTPLAGIRSTVQLWERLPETIGKPDAMASVVGAVDRLNETVSRLLCFSRVDIGERQPVNVDALLAETLKLVEAQAAQQNVSLELALDANALAVHGSASGLRQVFQNLTANALQAMPTGGRLRCSTRIATGADKIEIRFADTGPGVAPEVRAHLFEPFFTTRADGTGLGLALCREIVSQHAGRIELEPGEGPGATFRVDLLVGNRMRGPS